MSIKKSLNALPCFNQITSISTIPAGLSQSCFKVSADNKVYFAKTINDKSEIDTTVSAAKLGISPKVIYSNQQWLISHFIDANNLELSTLTIENKIPVAIKLMAKCHQLKVSLEELSPKTTINTLLDSPYHSLQQKTALTTLAHLITAPLNNHKKSVFCHGDINFSNVLLNQEQRTWLVDYECACTAPIEYDLAMFIAINNLDNNGIKITIEQYEQQSDIKIDEPLLKHYLLFSYFINTLWYFNASQNKIKIKNTQVLLKHAKTQWYALQALLRTNNSYLLSRLGIKLTNILPTFDFSNQT